MMRFYDLDINFVDVWDISGVLSVPLSLAPGSFIIKIMSPNQEEALYDFLENVTEPFTLEEAAEYIQIQESKRTNKLALEIAAFIDFRKIAFKLDDRHWVSRRGCFEPVAFVITPTRLELLNGILIPGHRCAPFANPLILPHEYEFFWRGFPIPETTTEGPPEELYPYYFIYGEEYAPQYIARDNPENESAFNCDPYEDPPEVSIRTLDMRNIYRELSFVPGDRFIVQTLDWKEGHFNLDKIGKDEWNQTDLYNWVEAAESGFQDSFALLGPGNSTEEQIAYAYWYGGKRMREIPAYSLEEFLYEKTERIETVPYGIETRFWFSGKEIPDSRKLQGFILPPDLTMVENLLVGKNIPISEYVVQSYVRDALFRNEKDIDQVINRVIPPVIHLEKKEWELISCFIADTMESIGKGYSLFTDQGMGQTRHQVVELHTAVIELSARLQKGEIKTAWLPRHTFIVLSQIQGHAASLLEDLAFDDSPPEQELETMDNSLDCMVETFTDIKELIDEAMDNFRKNNLMVVHSGEDKSTNTAWRIIQISVGGTDIWRRALIPGSFTMADLHLLIQAGMNWKNNYQYRFYYENPDNTDKQYMHDKARISDVDSQGKNELIYEYGAKWNIKIIIMSSYHPEKEESVRFVAGAGAAPLETVSGPLRFRRILSILETGTEAEKQNARYELGPDFTPDFFDMEKSNRIFNTACAMETKNE
ncbi:MAG: plasmid pRiA4b ORF-3 family protein [Treponema sp.]|nr:plasmid pRiA4b ORF-3 family protein [Treponema sp.]